MRICGRLRPILAFVGTVMVLGGDAVFADTMDRIVATVNGDIILHSELKERVKLMERVTPELKTADFSKQTEIEREVLQQMVRERLAEDEVKRLKINVGSREVDEAIENIKHENKFSDAQLRYMIQQEGQTFEMFRDGIKKELERARLIERVLKSKTVITQDQIDAFLKSGQGDSSKERRRIALIFLPEPEGGKGGSGDMEKQAREILEKLKDGADFGKLARQFSKGPAAEDGGDIGLIGSDELSPPIAAATKGLKSNGVSDVIKGPGGFYIVKVLDVQKEKMDSADASSRDKARRQLFQNEINRKFEEWIKDLEGKAFIKISL